MSDLSAERPGHPSASIVDLVFAGETGGGGRRLALGAVTVLACYVGLFVAVSRLGRSAGPWSAEMAARIHEAVAAETTVNVTPPTPPPPPVTSSEPKAESPRLARLARASHARPAAPAQAGQLAAASLEPADFTGTAFVVGVGSSYAGGTTTSHGTSKTPARGIVAPGGSGDGAGTTRSQARPVSLDQEAWSCPWPADADAQQVNEQTVVLRATVRADGRAERVDVLADPGYGFGAAARLCALATRFEPARDPAGQPVTSLSPPIRVHFFR
ncbi:MAG TPA: ferric siderophore ABC transporter substrate-binding protein [Polyangia bacterium]